MLPANYPRWSQSGKAQAKAPGSVNPYGTWSSLTNQPPAGVFIANMLLLTDGTVMGQNAATGDWYKLTPNNTGSYLNGTWTQLATMPGTYAPTWYASQVLPNGKVFTMGGEYNGNSGEIWENLGALYDPAANSWSSLTAPAGFTIGDDQSLIFPDGTLMIADISSGQTATCDPSNFTWTIHPGTGKADRNDEEGWTLLPDGSVLTIDAIASPGAQRYDKTNDDWISAGSTVATLEDSSSQELGPMLLRYDGTVVAEGATGHIGIYTPPSIFSGTGSWAAGPDFPKDSGNNQIGVEDGPACLLPNGSILMMGSPITGGGANDPFNAPSTFYNFGTDNTLNPISPPIGASGMPSFVGCFLILPSGEALFSSRGVGPVQIFTPTGSPSDSWRPTISTAFGSVAPSSDNSIAGTQFTGFSSGSAYGDDLQNATNYPLVRITNNSSGHVVYCKTHDWTPGVATGAAPVSAQFAVPASIETGNSMIQVVTNGIPSNSSFIQIGAPTLSLSSSSIGGGHKVTGTVTLTGNAPVGGATITFNSNQADVTTPTAITVPAGSNSTTFEIDTATQATDESATLSVSYGATSSNVGLTVKANSVASVSFGGASVVGGNNVSFTVNLSAAAPVGGTTVDFTCPSGLITVPHSLTIPAGQSSQTFTFATKGVANANASVIVGASAWNGEYDATIEIDPASVSSISAAAPSVTGGNVDTIIVNLNGAAPDAGISTTLSSSSISQPSPTINFGAQAHQGTVRMTTNAMSSDLIDTLSVPSLGGSTGSITVLAAKVNSLSVAPGTVVGGNPVLVTIALNGPAPTGGLRINLNPTQALIAPNVTVPAGATYVQAAVATQGVSSTTSLSVSNNSHSASLTLNPPTVSLGGPSTVQGGKSFNMLVSFNGKASNGNGSVNLTSNSAVITASDATIPDGSSSVVKVLSASTVNTDTAVTITSHFAGATSTYTVTVKTARLMSVVLASSSVSAGSGTYGAVYFNGPLASAHQVSITSDDSSHVTITPSSQSVGSGKSGCSFTVNVKAGTSAHTVTVTATDTTTSQSVTTTFTVS